MLFAGWTLFEIHSGSADTHALAAAAKAQAEYASAIAQSSRDSAASARDAIERNTIAHRISERAWIEIVLEPQPKIPADGRFPDAFVYGIYLKNTGKTAARDVTVKRINSSGNVDKRAIRMVQEERFRSMETGTRVAMPVVPTLKALAPGTVTPAPAMRAAIQAPYRFRNSSRWEYSYLIGRIDYRDDFGVAHWLKFCFSAEADGAVRYCESGNEVDQNPELP